MLGGGLLQLVATGRQDIYLSGNPQTTFFKQVYRRHTNFALESCRIDFDGAADFGKVIVATIPRKGDLVNSLILEISLPCCLRPLKWVRTRRGQTVSGLR